MPSAKALLLDRQLCFALYAASRAVTQCYGPLLEPLGLTYPQYLAMLVLWEEDAVSVKHIGERLDLDSGTLTPLLKRLEAMHLVERRRDPEDERVVRIHLARKGAALKEKALGVPEALVRTLGEDLSHVQQLRDELVALTRRLRHRQP